MSLRYLYGRLRESFEIFYLRMENKYLSCRLYVLYGRKGLIVAKRLIAAERRGRRYVS